MIWIEGSEDHTEELIRRFTRAPKPMYYQPQFLNARWADYLAETGLSPDAVNPDDFIRNTYAAALHHRAPLYRDMAKNWGLRVSAEDVARVSDAQDVIDLIASALEARGEIT